MKKVILLNLFFSSGLSMAAPFTAAPQNLDLILNLPNRITSDLEMSFKEFDVKLDFDDEKQIADINIIVTVDSVITKPKLLQNSVKENHVFDAVNYPTLTFKTKNAKYSGDVLKEILGDLTMKGITVPITFKTSNFKCNLHPLSEKRICSGTFNGVVDRNKFGIVHPTYLGYYRNLEITFNIIEALEN